MNTQTELHEEPEEELQETVEELNIARESHSDKESSEVGKGDKESPISWMISKLRIVHPAFLIIAILATIWIQWVMIPMSSFRDHPTMWWGLGVYLVVTILSILLLRYLFSIGYKTLLSVMTANNIALTIPLGAIISLATGYTLVQLFSPEWEFTHDFVYVMLVCQLVVTCILLSGIWWKARKEAGVSAEETFGEDERSERIEAAQPSMTHTSRFIPNRDLRGLPGMVNGLTNGLNLGLRNHTTGTSGLTNGLGMVNGVSAGFENSCEVPRRRHRIQLGKLRRMVVPLTSFGLIALLLFLPVLMVPSYDSIADREWSGVASYTDDIEGTDPRIDISEYSATSNEEYLWTKVEVSGKIMGQRPRETSTLYIFIDSDRNPDTGYAIESLGADRLIKVYGYEGVVSHSQAFTFMAERSAHDWNGWHKIGSVQSSISKDTLQTKIPMAILGENTKPLVYFGMVDSAGSQDYSDTCIDLANEGTLIIKQSNIGGDIIERGLVEIMELELTARGRTIVLESVDINLNPEIASSLTTPITIREDYTKKFLIRVDTSAMKLGSLVSVEVDPAGIGLDQGQVIVKGDGAKAYVGGPPASIRVDGAFGDWIDETRNPVKDRAGEVENPNIDLIEYQNGWNSGKIYFYMRVNGTMMGGVKIPALSEKRILQTGGPRSNRFKSNYVNIGASSQTDFLPPPLSGDDVAHIFIDSDQDTGTGYRPMHPFEFPIGADYMIEIRGREGEIKSSAYFRYSGEQREWNWTFLGSTLSACDTTRLETEISLEALNLDEPLFDAYLHITDWHGEEDYSDRVITDGGSVLHDFIPTRKNGGFPDGDIDTIDGGSCAGAFGCHTLNSNQVPITISFSPSPPYQPGQQDINITVTINLDNAAPSSLAGISVRVGPSGGNARYGIENDGWVIQNDPHGNTNNYIQESGLQGQGDTEFYWIVTAPSSAGTYYVEATVWYDNNAAGKNYNISSEVTITVIPEYGDLLVPVLVVSIITSIAQLARRRSSHSSKT